MGLLDSIGDAVSGSSTEANKLVQESIGMKPVPMVEKLLEAIELSEEQGREDHSTCAIAHIFLAGLLTTDSEGDIADLFEGDPVDVADGHLNHAQRLLNSGQVKSQRMWPILWSNKAEVALLRENYGLAIDYSRRATQFEDPNPEVYRTLGTAHSHLDNDDLAKSYQQKYNELAEEVYN